MCTKVSSYEYPKDEQRISIYPNPTQDRFTVTSKINKAYSLVDLNGKTRGRGMVSEEDSVDMSHLEGGIYILIFEYGLVLEVVKL